MARKKAFDREQALLKAMNLFWEQGYETTSTEDLLQAMEIGRQSMYDTFGDKQSLYLEAYQRYQAEFGLESSDTMRLPDSPINWIKNSFLAIAQKSPEERAKGCMGVNAVVERIQFDPEVAALVQAGQIRCVAMLTRLVKAGQRKGEMDATLNPQQVGQYLLSILQGLQISAKAGTPPEVLAHTVELSLRSLEPR